MRKRDNAARALLTEKRPRGQIPKDCSSCIAMSGKHKRAHIARHEVSTHAHATHARATAGRTCANDRQRSTHHVMTTTAADARQARLFTEA